MTKKTMAMLALFPIILVLIGSAFLQHIFPIYAGSVGYDQDPAYVYLFSGLTILDGHSPSHVDHPGTPLQILIAVITFVEWLISRIFGLGGESVIDSVLAKPEVYMQSISYVLLILNAWAVWFFGRRIFLSTNSVKLAIFCQTAPLAFSGVAPRIVYLAPEALLTFTSLLLIGMLTPFIFNENESNGEKDSKNVPLIGVLCGFGVAVKITFFPMLGLLLLLVRKSNLIQAIKYAAITLLICISPVIGKVPQIWNWVYSLTIHSGRHGAGGATVFDSQAMMESAVDLFHAFPFFYYATLVLAFALILKAVVNAIFRSITNGAIQLQNQSRRKSVVGFLAVLERGRMRIPLVLLSVAVLQTIMIMKHPGIHYLIPVLPIAFVGCAWLIYQCLKVIPSSLSIKWLTNILLAIACIMVINSSVSAYNQLRDSRLIQDKSLATIQAKLSEFSNPLVIGSYRCPLPVCSLGFGLGFAPNLSSKVAPLLANFAMFNGWNKKLYINGGEIMDLDRINVYLREGRKILLVSPWYPELSAFNLKLIVETPNQSLYEVIGVSGDAP